jgi:hypothetical protein
MSMPSWCSVRGLTDRPTTDSSDRSRNRTSPCVSRCSHAYMPEHVQFPRHPAATVPPPCRRRRGARPHLRLGHVGEASLDRVRDPLRAGIRSRAARQGDRHAPSVRARASPSARRPWRAERARHLCHLWLPAGCHRRRLVPLQSARRARRPWLPGRVCRCGARHERPCDLGEHLTPTPRSAADQPGADPSTTIR